MVSDFKEHFSLKILKKLRTANLNPIAGSYKKKSVQGQKQKTKNNESKNIKNKSKNIKIKTDKH